MADTAMIRLTQLPVIEEQLRALKESWEQKAKDAEAMVCTEDTVQDIKKARADMRKEHDEAETQRKAVKAQYMAPWMQIEAIYKECVEDAYNRADKAYKDKVAEVEGVQKAECEQKCREYFSEVCAVHGVSWLRFEQTGLKISLTEAKKKAPNGHFQSLNDFAARVACDMDAIGDDAETAAEYKANGLNLARAQKSVKDRQEAQEAERKAAEERAERQKREAEAVARVEAAAPVLAPPVAVEVPKEASPVKTRFFRFYATDAQFEAIKPELKALVQKMKAEGIRYE